MTILTETIEWRSVETELPDDDTTVLIYAVADDYDVWIGYHDAGVWRGPDAMEIDTEVTHWAPLPEGPRP